MERVNPRPDVGGASARAFLLTVLGELVLPKRSRIWTGSLIAALESVGVEEKAARQALMRTASHGLISSERVGRRSRWQLTSTAVQLLTDGTERIYSFGRHAEHWDRRWLVVLLGSPETERRRRHHIRTRLTWAGLGTPAPGVWVTPDTAREKEVAAILEELDVEASSFMGPFGEIGDEQHVVMRAWALEEVASRYARFVESFVDLRPASPGEAFAAQVRLVNEWRQFPFLDPSLPRELLPAHWPGLVAVDTFHRRHQDWNDAAQRHWSVLCAAEDEQT